MRPCRPGYNTIMWYLYGKELELSKCICIFAKFCNAFVKIVIQILYLHILWFFCWEELLSQLSQAVRCQWRRRFYMHVLVCLCVRIRIRTCKDKVHIRIRLCWFFFFFYLETTLIVMFWYDNWYDGLVILVIHDGTIMLPESNIWIWNCILLNMRYAIH